MKIIIETPQKHRRWETVGLRLSTCFHAIPGDQLLQVIDENFDLQNTESDVTVTSYSPGGTTETKESGKRINMNIASSTLTQILKRLEEATDELKDFRKDFCD